MAEFAASIIGIVSAGTKVTLVLSQLAADVGSAGKEARMIGNEIRSFCAVVKTLGETLEKVQSSQYYAHCTELIQDMTNASMEMFTEILDASESLKGMSRGKEGKEARFGFVTRVQWAVFKKPKIMVLRAAIEAYKSNLALMLGTLNTAEKVARRGSIATPLTPELIAEEEMDRSLLQSLELDYRASLIDLAESEQLYEEEMANAAEQPVEQSSADFHDETRSLPRNSPSPRPTPWVVILVGSAREEIQSIRSSLSRTSIFDARQIQGQVSRHSDRLSVLMMEDQNRISQRWSAVLLPEISNLLASTSSESPTENRTHAVEAILPLGDGSSSRKIWLRNPGRTWLPTSSIGFNPKAAIDPFYRNVLKWFMGQSFNERKMTLNTLIHDIADIPSEPPDSTTSRTILTLDSSPRVAVMSPTQHSMFPKTAPILRSMSQRTMLDQNDRSLRESTLSKRDEREQELLRLIQQQIISTAKGDSLRISLYDEGILNLSEKIMEALLRSNLDHLTLSRNRLTNLPASMAFCSHLRYLKLRGNEFEYIPNPILRLLALEMLDMSSNKLLALPPGISKMASLQVLSIEDNKIRGLPLAIGDMSSLRILQYQQNPIVFPAPEALEAFIPQRYAPSTEDYIEKEAQNTKRLKAFLKMTFPLSPSDELAIQGLPSSTSQSSSLPLFEFPQEIATQALSPGAPRIDRVTNNFEPSINHHNANAPASDSSQPVKSYVYPKARTHYRELSSEYTIPEHRRTRSAY